MVKHEIIWKFKDEVTDKELQAKKIKQALEGLVGKIDGLIEMHIHINGLESSNGSLMMDSLFSSFSALKNYQTHPLHQQVANEFVRPYMANRLAFDFEV